MATVFVIGPQGYTVKLVLRVGVSLTSYSHIVQRDCLRQVVAFAPKVIIGNYCLPPVGVLHSQYKVIKCAAYGVAQARGWRYGWIGGRKDGYKGGV
jgi:hypothetical protein